MNMIRGITGGDVVGGGPTKGGATGGGGGGGVVGSLQSRMAAAGGGGGVGSMGGRCRSSQSRLTFSRNRLVQVAFETVKIAERGRYINGHGETVKIDRALEKSMKHSVHYHYTHKFLPPSSSSTTSSGGGGGNKNNNKNKKTMTTFKNPCMVVVAYTSPLEAAAALCAEEGGGHHENHVGILNSASAINPGGRFYKGTVSHEDCICRSTLLYPCIAQFQGIPNHYYDVNASPEFHGFSSSCAIFSPNVPVIRRDTVELPLLDDYRECSFVSIPAPNAFKVATSGLDYLQHCHTPFGTGDGGGVSGNGSGGTNTHVGSSEEEVLSSCCSSSSTTTTNGSPQRRHSDHGIIPLRGDGDTFDQLMQHLHHHDIQDDGDDDDDEGGKNNNDNHNGGGGKNRRGMMAHNDLESRKSQVMDTEEMLQRALRQVMEDRIYRALSIFALHGCTDLVLTAFGCGVHGNDPVVVATIFREMILGTGAPFHGCFRRVVFAIVPSRHENYRAFTSVFAPSPPPSPP